MWFFNFHTFRDRLNDMELKSKKLLFSITILLLVASCLNDETKVSDYDRQNALKLLLRSKDKNLNIGTRIEIIEEGYNKIKKYPEDSIILAMIHAKSTLLYQAEQIDSLLYYDKFLNFKAAKISNDYYLAKSHGNIAFYFNNESNYDSAYFHYNNSKNYYLKLKDSSKVGHRLLNLALIQKNQNDFFGSKETLTEALQFLNSIKDQKYVASCYNALGTNHRKLLNFEDAENYYSRAISIANSEKDKCIYLNNLAVTYIDNRQYNKAISLLENLLRDSILINNQKEYARVLDNLTYVKWLSDKKMNNSAFLIPLEIRKESNDKRGQIASYTHLGEFYSKRAPNKAKQYFDTVIQLSKALKIPRAEKDVLKFLMDLEPLNVQLRDRYVYLQDSLYDQELKVKTQFAKYKYDDRVKQEENLRLEKENAEKKLEVGQQRTQKIMYLGGTIFLASILGLLLYSFKQRTKRLKHENKTARLEASFETEGALSRKLHDDYGGKLNHTISLVQNGADTSVILDQLEALDKHSRDFSREINEVDTGENYKEELLGMLGSRKTPNIKLFTAGIDELDWSVLPALTKTTLFKVLQELMINMKRHSKANTVAITLQDGNKEVIINYEDDGIGASKKELLLKNGLRNTEKRIQAIQGTITFDSEKGKGFRSEIRIPK